jgi:hypothetical protein
MKKLILLLAFAFIGCSAPETVKEKECNCISYTEVRQNNFTTGKDTGWYRNGGSSFYSNWCYDDGKIYGGHTTVQNNIEISDRQKVECK